ncbi:MAG TPA: TlpA disulfide reductase family protein [Gemmatimonadaceae bacterium]|nr:TlpA disulfide reductase family protein [Gemmatimonadaceae bacterium]
MSGARQWGLALGAAALLGGGWLAISARSAASVPVLTAGSLAPDFRAATLDPSPGTRTLADYRGHVVLLNLWATWCGPCEWEMPGIERLHRDFAPAGLKVVAVAVDDPGFEERVRQFVARHGLTFEILSEGTGAIERIYQARGLPATYLIGRDGIIRKRIAGASDWNSSANRALVAQLLGVAVPRADSAAAP